MRNKTELTFFFLPTFLLKSLCCGNNPGYKLMINGEVKAEGGAEDFGKRKRIDFN